MLYVFPYENYQYNLECLGLWNVFILSQNCIHPQYISFYWCLSLVIRTRIHNLNEINVWWIHTYKHNHHVIFIYFRHAQNFSLALTIILTRSLFVFIHFHIAPNFYTDDIQLLLIHKSNFRLICFVDVYKCFIGVFCFVGLFFSSASKLTKLLRSWTCFLILTILVIFLISKK